MKNIYLLGALLLLLISCSSANEKEKTLSNKAENTIAMLEQLQEKGKITEANYQEAKDNVIQYDSKGFFGRYWFGAVFLYYFFATFHASFGISSRNLDRAKPLSPKNVYLVWLFSGLWGGHLFYLENKHENGLVAFWKWISLVAILLVFLGNYTAIMYFWKSPYMLVHYVNTWNWSMPNSLQLYYSCWVVGVIFVVNIVGGLLFIPYITYVYNAFNFRQHYENDLILSGEKVEADKFYSRWKSHNNSLNKHLEEVITYVNEGYTIEDPDRDNSTWGGVKRFLKNVATVGKTGKLEKKMERLRCLSVCCQELEEDINETETYNDELYGFLVNSRNAAYRNLFLAKELIGVVKDKISSEQQKLLIDDFIDLDAPLNHSTGVSFRASDIQFDANNFFSSIGNDMDGTLNNLNKQIQKEGSLSKGDFISAGIEAGISTAIHGISNLIDLYSQTKEALLEVEEEIKQTSDYIEIAIPAIQKYQAALLRQSEVLSALTMCNKAFIQAYDPLREQVFGAPTFWKYLTGVKKRLDLFKTNEFRKDLQHLIMVSSQYNKVNQSKI